MLMRASVPMASKNPTNNTAYPLLTPFITLISFRSFLHDFVAAAH